MESELRISPIIESDLEKIIELGTTTTEFNTGTTAQQFYYPETLKRWIADPNGLTIAARIGQEIVGFALGYYMAGPNDGYLNCIVVNKNHRKIGIGKELLQRALSEFKAKGCNHVFGVVESENIQSIEFFRNNGIEIGREFKYVERMI